VQGGGGGAQQLEVDKQECGWVGVQYPTHPASLLAGKLVETGASFCIETKRLVRLISEGEQK
jgi:hypothetical protein